MKHDICFMYGGSGNVDIVESAHGTLIIFLDWEGR